MNGNEEDDFHTSTPCPTWSINALVMTSQLTCDAGDDATIECATKIVTQQLWREHVEGDI